MTRQVAIRVLETRRLTLLPLTLEDAPAIQRLFPSWEMVRLMSAHIPWPYPDDGALTFVRDLVLPAMARGEAWHWSIRLGETPEALIGVISLTLGDDDNRGFWLAAEQQGKGLMTEAAAAVTRFWFEDLGRNVLRAPKAVGNAASRRISQREGMRVVWTGENDYVSGRGPAELWEITAEEWRTRPVST
ncbi:GNAT family N-acetyltransferase [soil metagenome]